MKLRFNITGLCSLERHYMVRLNSCLERIRKDGSYFVTESANMERRQRLGL